MPATVGHSLSLSPKLHLIPERVILLALQTHGFGASLVSYPPTLWQQLPEWCRHHILNSLRFWRCTCTPTWLQWDTCGNRREQRLLLSQCSSISQALRLNLHSHLFVLEIFYINEKYSCIRAATAQKNGQNMVTQYPTRTLLLLYSTKEVKVLEGSGDLVGG